MIDFIKSHAYETVLALVMLVFGSVIANFIKTVGLAVASYPLQVFLLCGCSFVAALFLSAMRDRRSVLVAEVEAKKDVEMRRMDVEREERAEAERRAEEDAERKLESAREIYRFSKPQLSAMLQAFCEESVGASGIKRSCDDPVCTTLVDAGVFVEVDAWPEYGSSYFVLSGGGREFVVEREGEIREYLGVSDCSGKGVE